MHLLLEKYVSLVEDYDNGYFVPSLKSTMAKRYKSAQADLTAEKIWDKYYQLRRDIRKIFGQLHDDYATMPSGNNLHQIIQGLIINFYKEAHTSYALATDDEVEEDMEEDFFLDHKICKLVL